MSLRLVCTDSELYLEEPPVLLGHIHWDLILSGPDLNVFAWMPRKRTHGGRLGVLIYNFLELFLERLLGFITGIYVDVVSQAHYGENIKRRKWATGRWSENARFLGHFPKWKWRRRHVQIFSDFLITIQKRCKTRTLLNHFLLTGCGRLLKSPVLCSECNAMTVGQYDASLSKEGTKHVPRYLFSTRYLALCQSRSSHSIKPTTWCRLADADWQVV